MRAISMRGEPQLIACPGCGDYHGSVARIEGLPVLPCPSVAEPGVLKLMLQPPSRAHLPICFLVGPAPEPVPASVPADADEPPRAAESIVPERRQRRSA